MTLNNAECLNRAKRIVKGLAGLKDGDALWILYTSINIIATRSGRSASPGTIQQVNVNLRPRKRGFPPILDKNPELRAYIHGLDRYLTIRELHAELVAKFGTSRVPGEETIRRYLKRLAQSNP